MQDRPTEEMDVMVLTMRAIEAHMALYSDAQQDIMMQHVRGLAAYEASRPEWKRPVKDNVIDLEIARVKARLEGHVRRERSSAIAETRNTVKHWVNAFGDDVYDGD
ncbi:hypothetical protein [Allorhizobium borbori]|uniref:Uncharacterized protein n=1 Tax=Allorhizobium borbori TaxID=485907 RepID=A0A7W6K1K3_9HYPH|nr:hypothetical protein [Allorhizobium borbori]MBB4102377.1 hypothetical protein [Allorhizobium borbori]